MSIDKNQPPKFVLCEVENYRDLYPQIAKLRSFIFRGHKCASWKLISSLEREHDKYPRSQMIEGAEADSIEYFKKRSHLYRDFVPNPVSIVDLLTAMQHYGCPTRLVDFTKSFRVATYFAVNDATQTDERFCSHNLRLLCFIVRSVCLFQQNL